MALNIPNVDAPGDSFLKGLNSGSSLISTIMKPILQRRHQEQLENHFQQELALRKQQLARAGANADLQRALLQEQLLSYKHKNDPMWELNNLRQAQEAFGGNRSTNEQMQMPTQEEGEGLGVFSPEGLESAKQNRPISNTNSGGIDMEAIKNSPLLRGYFKKHFGIDPAAGESNVLHGPARDAADLVKLKKDAGENSEAYLTAKTLFDAKKRQNEDLSSIRQRQLNGLKPGDTEIKDPNTGQTIGFRKQTDAKQKEAAKNTVLFNQLYPLVLKSADLLSGPGATQRLENAARNYNRDPASRKLIDDFNIALKAATTTAVTEAARFGAGRTNQTFNRFVETLKAEDIPKLMKKLIKEYQIPGSANLKAGMTWQKKLNEAEKLANSRIPATMDYYFDPEKQFAHEQEQQANSNDSEEQNNGSVIIIDPSGKRFETTEANATHLPQGWKRG